MTKPTQLPLADGFERTSNIDELYDALYDTIDCYSDEMTAASVIGTMEVIKAELLIALLADDEDG